MLEQYKKLTDIFITTAEQSRYHNKDALTTRLTTLSLSLFKLADTQPHMLVSALIRRDTRLNYVQQYSWTAAGLMAVLGHLDGYPKPLLRQQVIALMLQGLLPPKADKLSALQHQAIYTQRYLHKKQIKGVPGLTLLALQANPKQLGRYKYQPYKRFIYTMIALSKLSSYLLDGPYRGQWQRAWRAVWLQNKALRMPLEHLLQHVGQHPIGGIYQVANEHYLLLGTDRNSAYLARYPDMEEHSVHPTNELPGNVHLDPTQSPQLLNKIKAQREHLKIAKAFHQDKLDAKNLSRILDAEEDALTQFLMKHPQISAQLINLAQQSTRTQQAPTSIRHALLLLGSYRAAQLTSACVYQEYLEFHQWPGRGIMDLYAATSLQLTQTFLKHSGFLYDALNLELLLYLSPYYCQLKQSQAQGLGDVVPGISLTLADESEYLSYWHKEVESWHIPGNPVTLFKNLALMPEQREEGKKLAAQSAILGASLVFAKEIISGELSQWETEYLNASLKKLDISPRVLTKLKQDTLSKGHLVLPL